MFPPSDYHHHRNVERELGRIRAAAEEANARLEDLALTPEERVLRRATEAEAEAEAEAQTTMAWLVGVPLALVFVATVLGAALGLGGRLVWWVIAGLAYLVAAAIPLVIVVGIVSFVRSALRPVRGPTEPPR